MKKAKTYRLEVSEELRQALLLHRVRTGLDGEPALRGEDVEAVEAALGGVTLPDEILAVFAATGLDLYQVVTWTEDAWDRGKIDSDYLVIATQEEEDERPLRWCLAMSQVSTASTHAQGEGPAPRVCLWPSARKSPPTSAVSVVEFVVAYFRLGSASPEERRVVEGLKVTFSPRVTAAPVLPARTLWHPRFGLGKVVRELREGNHKLELDFPGFGRKIVLASYLQEPPPEASAPARGRRRRASKSATA